MPFLDAVSSQGSLEMGRFDDIAIVGYSFKLPQGVEDDSSFWDVLQNRRNLMTEWPESRINVDSFSKNNHYKLRSRGGHFIEEDVSAFDAPFFSVTAKEAASMDPMQRWSLEVAYHAFEKAGIPVETLKGSRTAVFSASMLEDYARLAAMDPDNIERTAASGSTVSCIIPNRISWYFDLRGPSIHVNTACSSSLSAVDMACKVLRSGDASCTLVTGANLLLDPSVSQMLFNQNFLSPDSVCYSFDHRANGYARGEGVIALVLKPVSSAVRDGDMIRAVIRATGSNQDGRTPVLTQPSPQAQEDLIRHVYMQANLPRDQTRYVEAHGTGTSVGDPIEMRAISQSFREYRSAEKPLYVGSVKANVGHLEGASALASIVKCILILEKGIIPPALLEKINPAIDTKSYRTTVPTQSTIWPSQGLRRISVNSFGFGGSNSHIIIDDALHYLQGRGLVGNHCTVAVPGAMPEDQAAVARTNGPLLPLNGSMTTWQPCPKLLIWTAADEKAAKRTVEVYDTFYGDKISGSATKLTQLAFTLAARRSHMLWRSFAVAGEQQSLSTSKPIRSVNGPALAFVFTGQGAQYADMGWDLVQYPVFEDTLRKVDDVYRSLGCKWSIFDELRSSQNIDKPEYSQPLSTAVQIGLVELLRSFGVAPAAVVGHSSGEIAAAYAIGALSLVSACKVSYFRGQLAGTLRTATSSSPGAMISINLSADEVAGYLEMLNIAKDNDSICIACINSPTNCTLAGLEANIDVLKEQADRDGIFAQELKTGVAYHSQAMKLIADEYLELMTNLEGPTHESPIPVTSVMISSVSGKVIDSTKLTQPEYWVKNMVSPVRFADAVQALMYEASTGITDLVEIGPHPALRRSVQDTISQGSSRLEKTIPYGSPLHRSRPAIQTTLDLMGQLFCRGYPVSVSAVNMQSADRPFPFLVDCPPYPFERSKYWTESRISRDFRLRGTVQGETLGVRMSDWNPLQPRWRNFLSIESMPWIEHHKITDTVLYPAAGMLVMAIEAAQQMVPTGRTVVGYLVRRAEFGRPIIVREAWEDRTEIQVVLKPITGQQQDKEAECSSSDINIFSYSGGQWTECCQASIQINYQESLQADGAIEEKGLTDEGIRSQFKQAAESCQRLINSRKLYRDAAESGLQYGEWFQILQGVRWDGKSNAIARVDVSGERYQTSSLVHPAILDQAFQALRVSAGQQRAANIPVRLFDAWFAPECWQSPHTSSIRWLATASKSSDRINGEQGAVYALAEDGTVLCTIRKVVTATVSLEKVEEKEKERKLLYDIEWKPQLSLMTAEQLALVCKADSFTRDERLIRVNHAKLRSALDLVIVHTLNHLDRSKIPDNLRRHVEWMEYHVQSLPSSQREQGTVISDTEIECQLQEVETVLPAWKVYTTCARKLPEILAGEADPLQTVFESDLAKDFYADLFQNLCADGRLSTILDLAAHENPALRVLEVGAGTGGMTGYVLDAFQEREKRTGGLSFAEYMYTDISPAFFEKARARWPGLQEQGRVAFKTLDLDKSIADQGFELGSYDLVIAASVLHATPDLEATIRNVRSALKPNGGRMILLEVVNPDDIAANFMAGLVPGWWVAREEWRPHSAAVPEHLWDKCLRANGFSGNDVVIRDYQSEECRTMSIIVTTAVEGNNKLDGHGRLVLIVDDTQQHLATSVSSNLNRRVNRTISTCAFSPDQIQGALSDLTKDDTVICLIEVNNRPLLAKLSEESFAALQILVRLAPNLLWVTATSINDAQYPEYSIVQGFLRSIRTEQADNHIVSLAIEGDTDAAVCARYIVKVFQTSFELSSSSSSSDEVEYVVRDGRIMSGRVIENGEGNRMIQALLSPAPQNKPWLGSPPLKLSVGTHGTFDTLAFIEDTIPEKIGSKEVEIEAKAWGLDYKDVQTALGYSGDHEILLGSDCAGIITRVGSDCDSSLKPGDRVAILANGCLRMYPRADEKNVIKIPDTLPFETVTATLVPGMTAYYALTDVAQLQEGDNILIHNAARRTGQIFVQIAKMHGAQVFATASSVEERSYLGATYGIPDENIFHNRPTSFAQGVMNSTKRYGVDIVINSLQGEDALRASCECLASGGRFIEIGRGNIDVNATLPLAILAQNVCFSVIDTTQFSSTATARLSIKTMELLKEGWIRSPGLFRVFNASEVRQAFQHLESDKNIGRVVIVPQPEDMVPQPAYNQQSWTFNEDASYLIAGGFGGLGRAVIQWMADRGAKYFIVPSRSGASSKVAAELLADLAAQGVKIVAPKCDVSSEESLALVLDECMDTMPPIKGCINAAMVLQDAIFQNNMTFAQWDLTMHSKVQTSWNLHRLLPPDVDFFILLSSLAGVVGQMASANYAGGCSFQDALARYRIARGQKALSLDLGWMHNIGIIAETDAYQRQRQVANDMQPIKDTEFLALLTLCLDPMGRLPLPRHVQVPFGLRTPADVLIQGEQVPALLDWPLFAAFSFIAGSQTAANTSNTSHQKGHAKQDVAAGVLFHQSTDGGDRKQIVLRALATKLARAMAIPVDDVQPNKPLSAYGVDSLMTVELRNWLRREFGATVAVFDIMGDVPLSTIANLVVVKSAEHRRTNVIKA